MKINPRTLALSAGWLLAIAIGFLIGRQTGVSPSDQSAAAGSAGRPAPFTGSGASGETRPASASKRSDKTPDPSPRRSRERTIAALGEALRHPDRLTRTRRVLDLADTLSTNEFEEVVEAFRADGISRMRGSEYSLLLNAWVNADPFAAAEYVEASDDSAGSRRTVMAAWAAMDANSAKAWIDGREDDGETNDWTVGLVSGIASNDPDNALRFIEDIEARGTRIKSLQSIIPHVLQHGTEYATDWVAGISNEELRLGSLRNLARELHHLDAEQAGSWVGSLLDPDSQREATLVVAEQWARTSLDEASQWAATLPADNKALAAGSIARQMARFDPEQAAIWLRSLGTDPSLDRARRTFISEAAGKAPQVALENVYTLSQPGDQEKMYHQVLKGWEKRNAKAVKTWVDYNIDALPASVVKRYAPTPKPPKPPKKDPKKPAKNKPSKKQGKV